MLSSLTDDRPDPDLILARVQRDASRAARGKLRIYFGACAGVGKTYAMLLAARRAMDAGLDVVVGIAETHGRTETAALLHGENDRLEILPRRIFEHKERTLSEFDLDAALLRHPSLLIVDELAHTNVSGSRHPKRWQDVAELLAAGIDVYTALNVQHLESLSDVVAGITGIRVQETVPDRFFDEADQVVVVDLPPEELLKRLAEGQVYGAEQAQRAAKNFFRRGNLLALREIALRRTADRVEEDVQNYRVDRAIKPVWKTEGSLLCCVGPDPGDEHIVRSAARLAHGLDVPWTAAYVETPRLQRLSSIKRERILGTIRLAKDLGANTVILSGSDVADVLVQHARTGNFSKLVMGRARARMLWRPRLAPRVARLGSELDLISVGRESAPVAEPVSRPVSRLAWNEVGANPKTPRRIRAFAGTVGACALATGVSTLLLPFVSLANIAMVFLLVVALVALRAGRGPAVLAAFLNVALFDFFFVPPRFSFAVADLQYLVTFAVMLTVALIIGQLTARLRYEARVASHREGRAHDLYEFARKLSSALRVEDVNEESIVAVERAFRCEAIMLTTDERGDLILPAELTARVDFDPAIAQWTLSNAQSAGTGTDTLPSAPWLYLPLQASMRVRGVLAAKPASRRLLMIPEQQRQLETFASLMAIALERVHYVEIAQKAMVNIESERLRNSILSALSHDLRTPLTVLVGLADSMSYIKPALSREHEETLKTIREEAHRMTTLVENLLEMARIQSGEIHLRRAWIPIEELVGVALEVTKTILKGRPIKTAIAPDLPLVEMDLILMERVFVNLLENIAKYTPAHTNITLGAFAEPNFIVLSVSDDGPGLPASFRSATDSNDIFEKFTRGEKESARSGVGLGLAICKAIVEAHEGTIRVDPNVRLGTSFVIRLPRGIPPVIDENAELASAHD